MAYVEVNEMLLIILTCYVYWILIEISIDWFEAELKLIIVPVLD